MSLTHDGAAVWIQWVEKAYWIPSDADEAKMHCITSCGGVADTKKIIRTMYVGEDKRYSNALISLLHI